MNRIVKGTAGKDSFEVIKMLVLFNLKKDISSEEYEDWAKKRDIPAVRALASVGAFDVHRTQSLLNPSEPLPYSYVEVVEFTELENFKSDVAQTAMQEVAMEFRQYADDPVFAVLEAIK